MLSLELIREKPDLVKAGIAAKNEGPEIVDEILERDRQRRVLLQQADSLKHHRNEVSDQIAVLKRAGQDAATPIAEMKEVGAQISSLDEQIKAIEGELHDLLLSVPNLPHPSVPLGASEQGEHGCVHVA